MHCQSKSSITEMHGLQNVKDNEQSIERIDDKTPISPEAQNEIRDNEEDVDIEDMFVKINENNETTTGDTPQTTENGNV